MRYLLPVLVLTFSAVLPGHPAIAGPAAENLSACLVDATSPADRTTLRQWLFSAMSVHPDLNQFVQVTEEERIRLEQDTAGIFQRLLAEDCGTETRAAFIDEGINGVQGSFGALGQVAIGGLFENPAVISGLSSVVNYVDLELLGETLLSE